MKKLKVGAQIKTNEDAVELIKNLIKNSDEFSQAFITKLAINYISGSPLKMPNYIIEKMVEDVVYKAMMNNEIYCDFGMFYKTETVKAL